MLHFVKRIIISALSAIVVALPIQASEQDAVSISENIQALHTPYDTLLDPVFASSDPASAEYTHLVNYTRAGDSAIWTGHYLAAEAFRYQMTRSPEALENALQALHGITSLLDITGTDLLARCLVPANSPYANAIRAEEAGHGIYDTTFDGQPYFWTGDTSRDQYSGVFFGLSAAYDLIDNTDARSQIQTDVSRMLDFLLRNNWNVRMPDGTISATFLGRPEQQLSFLQVGRHVNPAKYDLIYRMYRALLAAAVRLPIQADCADDHDNYFKFNLDYINLYNLIRLEYDSFHYRRVYLNAYSILRNTTQSHGNAHFNMIDRALQGANSSRDEETSELLELWLKRSRRDYYVDLRGIYPACGTEKACSPIPVDQRVNTDFLWQRSPFLLYGGGDGTIETAAIDYILPYWMARYYGVAAETSL